MSVFGLASNVRVRTKAFKGSAPNTPYPWLCESLSVNWIQEQGGIDMDTKTEETTYKALLEAEKQSKSTTTRHTHKEVMEVARKSLDNHSTTDRIQ